jgi:wyosine [tRNA(Phe)-imidazoG37] synthetase (radical SAM superfamily)
MPEHAEVLAFAKEISISLGYRLEDDVPLSRVALLTNGKVSRNIF